MHCAGDGTGRGRGSRRSASRAEPIPIDEALPIAKQIAEALEAAHEQGIIHRDLKPANIKVRPDGTVKVLDFGLAKAMEPAGRPCADTSSQSPTITTPAMTHAGMILGTAAYMSPEQARGKPVDRRADIWAFGVVLFEMLTGRRAFEGDDIAITLAAVMMKEPDWSALPAPTPVALRRLLTRCLKKDPKARMRDIGDARLQIEELLSGAPEEAGVAAIRRVPSLWRRVVPWAAAGALAVGLALIVMAVIALRRAGEAVRCRPGRVPDHAAGEHVVWRSSSGWRKRRRHTSGGVSRWAERRVCRRRPARLIRSGCGRSRASPPGRFRERRGGLFRSGRRTADPSHSSQAAN